MSKEIVSARTNECLGVVLVKLSFSFGGRGRRWRERIEIVSKKEPKRWRDAQTELSSGRRRGLEGRELGGRGRVPFPAPEPASLDQALPARTSEGRRQEGGGSEARWTLTEEIRFQGFQPAAISPSEEPLTRDLGTGRDQLGGAREIAVGVGRSCNDLCTPARRPLRRQGGKSVEGIAEGWLSRQHKSPAE